MQSRQVRASIGTRRSDDDGAGPVKRFRNVAGVLCGWKRDAALAVNAVEILHGSVAEDGTNRWVESGDKALCFAE